MQPNSGSHTYLAYLVLINSEKYMHATTTCIEPSGTASFTYSRARQFTILDELTFPTPRRTGANVFHAQRWHCTQRLPDNTSFPDSTRHLIVDD